MDTEPALAKIPEMFEWARFARNTFVDVHGDPPPELELNRAATEPANATAYCNSSKAAELHEAADPCKEAFHGDSGDIGDCPPPPLQLECLETYDPFEGQQASNPNTMAMMLGSLQAFKSTWEESTASPGTCKAIDIDPEGTESDASLADVENLPPAPLNLECLETYDPFEHFQQSEPQAAVPETAWTVFAKNTFLDIQELEPPPLDLCRASTEPIQATVSVLGEREQLHAEQDGVKSSEQHGEQSKAEVDESSEFTFCPLTAATVIDEIPPPPLLELESFETEDSFNKPQLLAEQVHGSKVNVVELEPAIATRLGGPPPPPSTPMPVMPTPPPPPPSMPAPMMAAPCSPKAPSAPPSSGPKEDTNRPSAEELANHGMLICMPTHQGPTHVHWGIDARKLDSQHKQIVSPGFSIQLPGQGQKPFKMVVYPKAVNVGKHGAGFRKAKGVGRVMIKCEAQLEEKRSDLVFRISIGRDSKLQLPRGPVTSDFFEQSCHGLPKSKEEWDFTASVDDSNTFLVSLQIAPLAVVIANPHLWWPAAKSSP